MTGKPPDERAAAKAAKLDFDLHLSLVMRQDNCSKGAALLRIYREGRGGLNTRLSGLQATPAKP